MTKTNKNRLVLLLGYVVLITGCLCVLLPLSWMVITSLKSMTDITLSKGLKLFPSGPTLENFANIWKEYQEQYHSSRRIHHIRRYMCGPVRLRLVQV